MVAFTKTTAVLFALIIPAVMTARGYRGTIHESACCKPIAANAILVPCDCSLAMRTHHPQLDTDAISFLMMEPFVNPSALKVELVAHIILYSGLI
ncbi:hypothetical protein BKA65DRAFT_589545 [Rhexocercosporidium sp. MPI-PUGE-AT-0058]|nr:hypothetical protein BKA65DRAFT_589545 [Rhexocercosporidium sp. MPI-PUGE-AT-0058]